MEDQSNTLRASTELSHTAGVNGNWKSLRKTLWRFLKALKTEVLYDPATLLLGIHMEKMEALL